MNSEQSPASSAQTTRMVIDRFNEAFNRHDAEALALLLTDDTVFEDTCPQPDGRRIEGRAAVVEFWVLRQRSSNEAMLCQAAVADNWAMTGGIAARASSPPQRYAGCTRRRVTRS